MYVKIRKDERSRKPSPALRLRLALGLHLGLRSGPGNGVAKGEGTGPKARQSVEVDEARSRNLGDPLVRVEGLVTLEALVVGIDEAVNEVLDGLRRLVVEASFERFRTEFVDDQEGVGGEFRKALSNSERGNVGETARVVGSLDEFDELVLLGVKV